MSEARKVAIRETVKEFLRYMWFGLIGLVIAYLQAIITGDGVNELTALVVGFIIRMLDKYVHENKRIDSNGLAPTFLQK